MREIKASEKARGAKRWKSVEAAKRRVEDGKLYLVCRHNAWFRPDGMGYTNHLAAAGWGNDLTSSDRIASFRTVMLDCGRSVRP